MPSSTWLRLVVVLVALVTTVAGCRDACIRSCMQAASALPCQHPEHCQTSCQTLKDMPVCKPELQAYQRCFTKEPPSGWTCDEDGLPVLKTATCAPEKAVVSACLEKTPAPVQR